MGSLFFLYFFADDVLDDAVAAIAATNEGLRLYDAENEEYERPQSPAGELESDEEQRPLCPAGAAEIKKRRGHSGLLQCQQRFSSPRDL